VVPENRGQLLLKFLQGRRVPGELLGLEDEDEDEEAEEADGPPAVVGAKDPLAFLMAPAATPASRLTRRRRRQPMSAEAAEVDRLAQALQLSSSNSEDEDEDEEAEDEGYSEEDSGAEEDEDSDAESEESDEDVIGAAKPRPPRVNGEEAYRRLLADFDRNAQRQRRHANDLRPIQFAIREVCPALGIRTCRVGLSLSMLAPCRFIACGYCRRCCTRSGPPEAADALTRAPRGPLRTRAVAARTTTTLCSR